MSLIFCCATTTSRAPADLLNGNEQSALIIAAGKAVYAGRPRKETTAEQASGSVLVSPRVLSTAEEAQCQWHKQLQRS